MKQLSMCIFCVLTLCIFCVQISIIDLLNIFADHKYNENLTHAQTTSTRPSCLPNRYKSENSAWDRGYFFFFFLFVFSPPPRGGGGWGGGGGGGGGGTTIR